MKKLMEVGVVALGIALIAWSTPSWAQPSNQQSGQQQTAKDQANNQSSNENNPHSTWNGHGSIWRIGPAGANGNRMVIGQGKQNLNKGQNGSAEKQPTGNRAWNQGWKSGRERHAGNTNNKGRSGTQSDTNRKNESAAQNNAIDSDITGWSNGVNTNSGSNPAGPKAWHSDVGANTQNKNGKANSGAGRNSQNPQFNMER